MEYGFKAREFYNRPFFSLEDKVKNLVGEVCFYNGNSKRGGDMSDQKLINMLKKRISSPPENLSNREIYDSFCIKYGEAIGPKIEAIDKHQAKSMERAFTKVVR